MIDKIAEPAEATWAVTDMGGRPVTCGLRLLSDRTYEDPVAGRDVMAAAAAPRSACGSPSTPSRNTAYRAVRSRRVWPM
ncbi:hypothetical protein [Pseudofrankia asymbiotica]|uniref:Uncharacterized protein n=1 Tax=Pseudofrankia asymbiotica TaxID=1834516 RepID=A0A1V2I551_9ACTN|nr:hypothetical protein [Pseudofrankia asymbiotica]ONH25504.1 hypothetical protein BL253_27240 [Pseudofrankia asymbiotica]